MSEATVSVDVMKQIPILRGLSDPEIEHVLQIAEMVVFSPGQLVLEQGKQSQRLWILLEGQCEVCHHLPADKGTAKGEPLVLATLEPYSNFGEMSFFHPAPHSASVRAKTSLKLLAIDRSKFNHLVASECSPASKLAINTVASLAERLRRMDDWVTELMSGSAGRQRNSDWTKLRATLFDGWNL